MSNFTECWVGSGSSLRGMRAITSSLWWKEVEGAVRYSMGLCASSQDGVCAPQAAKHVSSSTEGDGRKEGEEEERRAETCKGRQFLPVETEGGKHGSSIESDNCHGGEEEHRVEMCKGRQISPREAEAGNDDAEEAKNESQIEAATPTADGDDHSLIHEVEVEPTPAPERILEKEERSENTENSLEKHQPCAMHYARSWDESSTPEYKTACRSILKAVLVKDLEALKKAFCLPDAPPADASLSKLGKTALHHVCSIVGNFDEAFESIVEWLIAEKKCSITALAAGGGGENLSALHMCSLHAHGHEMLRTIAKHGEASMLQSCGNVENETGIRPPHMQSWKHLCDENIDR